MLLFYPLQRSHAGEPQSGVPFRRDAWLGQSGPAMSSAVPSVPWRGIFNRGPLSNYKLGHRRIQIGHRGLKYGQHLNYLSFTTRSISYSATMIAAARLCGVTPDLVLPPPNRTS